MTPEQFCYWLQGRVELQPTIVPSKEEWDMIGAHLQTVFRKVTPQPQPGVFWGVRRSVEDVQKTTDDNQSIASRGLQGPSFIAQC